jgi:hypothetical protein
MTSDPTSDHVTSVPYSVFSRGRTVSAPALPFSLKVLNFYTNARLLKMGAGWIPEELPPETGDSESNSPVAHVELFDGSQSLGSWFVSSSPDEPQQVSFQGQTYQLIIRPKRIYLPYTLTLKDFRHEVYPGTNIPKSFSSLIHLDDPGRNESRDILIYMNHPWRYGGRAFYQASYGDNDTTSILQVVKNPVWMTPYVSSGLMALGLLLQFSLHLIGFMRKPS